MNTIEVKTSELEGAALDWATFCALYTGMEPTIHVADPVTIERKPFIKPLTFPRLITLSYSGAYGVECAWMPSGDWGQIGPIIQDKKVMITYHNGPDRTPMATTDDLHPHFESGKTVPIAACRAIVAAKMGSTVQVPADLIGGAA